MRKTTIALIVFFSLGNTSVYAVCGIPWGGDWTNSGTCTIPAGVVDGVDNGTAYLPAGTSLIVNGTFVYSPNTGSIRPASNTAQITFGVNGQVRRSLAWYKDSDNDFYADAFAAVVLQNTAPGSPYKQKKDILGYDCDDANPAVFGGSPILAYVDADHDGYGAGSAVTLCGYTCATLPIGYSCNNTDCCDTDARAFPGQTAYFSDQRIGCGGYDFNCDGAVTKDQDDYQTGWNCEVVSPASCVIPCAYIVGQDNGPTGSTQSPDCGSPYTAYLGCEYKNSYCECPVGTGGVVVNDYGPKTQARMTSCR